MNYKMIPELKKVILGSEKVSVNDYVLSEILKGYIPVAQSILKEGNYTGVGQKLIDYTIEAHENAEYYSIEIKTEGIQIKATDERGVFYGILTLSELDKINEGILTCGLIEDYPDLEYRAISDDISRGQVSTFEHFKMIIRQLARYKYNVYMPYIEDVFKLKCCPDWGKYSDGLTGEEWQAITDYAKKYYMQVRPIINLLGHFNKNASIKSLQEITIHTKEGKPTSVIDPCNESVRPLMEQILDEVVEAFGQGVVHVGGDEPCELTEVYGKEEGGKLFIEYYTWMHDELAKRGCSMMMYADFFAPPWGDYAVGLERALELPKGVNFVFWDYAPRDQYPYVEKLNELGLEVTVSPGTWTWDRFACDMKVCWDNTAGLLKAANGNSKHMIMSCWGDGGDCARELNWPGFLIGANCSWATNTTYSFEEFYELYHALFLGLNKEEADALFNLYHYDSLIALEDKFIFKKEMFKSAKETITFKEKEQVHMIHEAITKVLEILPELKEKATNKTAIDAMLLGAMRIQLTAEKIMGLPWSPIMNREDARTYVSKVRELASKTEEVYGYHKKVWFDTNRNSDWEYVEMLYLDLRDELRSLERHLLNDKTFHKN